MSGGRVVVQCSIEVHTSGGKYSETNSQDIMCCNDLLKSYWGSHQIMKLILSPTYKEWSGRRISWVNVMKCKGSF